MPKLGEVAHPPLLFRIGKALIRRRLRGGHRLIRIAGGLGQLDISVRYDLNDRIGLTVPLWREDNRFDLSDILGYEREMVTDLAFLAESLPGEVVLVDCGADIGLFSAAFLARCPCIAKAHAFEPNAEAHAVLAENYRRLPMPATAHHAAIGNVKGKGRLVQPDYDPSPHAAFIEASETGDITLMRVDDLGLGQGSSLVLKIDVEGLEQDVIEGAGETLRRVHGFVVAMEANRDVVQRTGVDTCAILRKLAAIRPCTIDVAEAPGKLDLSRPFFSQFNKRVYNVVAYCF